MEIVILVILKVEKKVKCEYSFIKQISNEYI